MIGFDGEYPADTQEANFDIYVKKIAKRQLLTFHKKTYFTYFRECVYNSFALD